MHLLFDIQAPQIDTTQAHLLIEAGSAGISFFIINDKNNVCAIVMYSFTKEDSVNHLKEIVQTHPLLQQPYNKTTVIWSVTESISVPDEWMNSTRNKEIVELVYGDLNDGIIKSDCIAERNIHTVYRITKDIFSIIENKFPLANQRHQYSLLPKLVSKEGNQLLAVFYTHCVTVVLCKDDKLQLIQNFAYTNADDAAYHLLNVCQNFDVATDSVTLHLSGMIDANSNLYENLYKYFLNIRFQSLPNCYTYYEEIKSYPSHFFSHLFLIASCV